MSNQERESFASSIEQLQQYQKVLARYITGLKYRLDDLSEQFNNRPEIEQFRSLQDALAQLYQRSPSLEPPVKTEVTDWVDEQQPIQVQSYEYQLVFDRPGSRAVLMEALEKAQKRLIIVCPWLNRNSIDADLLQKLRDCLNRNCRIDIGWGHLSDRSRLGKGWRYNALKDLRQLEKDYPDLFKLKLIGTHEKFLICDSSFAMLGSHNLLTSSTQSSERELGIRTTDAHIIQGLINRFDSADVQNTQARDESLTQVSVSLNDTEVLEEQDISDESDAILVNPDDSTEEEPEIAVNAEELLRRYEAGERDFTGINLVGANLSGKSLESDSNPSKAVNLIKANLSSTNLSKANLQFVRLLQANLNKANLREANLYGTNFTAADLSGAMLMQANLQYANLTAADLSGAMLMQANLQYANLTAVDLSGAMLMQANLQYANLTATNLSKAKLTNANFSNTNLSNANLSKAQLGNANFSDANLSGANLTGASLVGVDFKGIKLSGITFRGANLCGANLSSHNLSGVDLTTANLCGADLSKTFLEKANLEKANLKGANLTGANLNNANLSGAIMPDGTTHE